MPEMQEPVVPFRALTAGNYVVEGYGHVALTRDHPVSFLRVDPQRQRVVSCAEAMQSKGWLTHQASCLFARCRDRQKAHAAGPGEAC